MPDKAAHARGWFLKGDSDLNTAKQMTRGKGPYDTACFHSQQACEKYLKGFLALSDCSIPPTHNLEELQRLGIQLDPSWPLAGVDLTGLTPYAVQVRYDFEFWPDLESAERAVELAERVRALVLSTVPKEALP